MSENIVSVRLEIKSQKAREDLEEIISSIDGFRLQKSVTAACDLLILEIGDDLKEEFKLIHALQGSRMAAEVFLTSSRLDPDLLIGNESITGVRRAALHEHDACRAAQ